MLDLINVSSSYHFKKANNLNQSLIFYKNILMLMSKKGFKHHNDDIVFPVRWSRLKDTWVVDFRTQKERDISGIELNNLSFFYSSSSITYKLIYNILNVFNKSINNEFWDKINIKKNETKFIAITCNSALNNDQFHIEGIYSFAGYKQRAGVMSLNNSRAALVDNSIETLTLVNNVLNSSKIKTHKIIKNKSYYTEYEKFAASLLKKSYTFTANSECVTLNMNDYLHINYKKIYSYKEAVRVYCLKENTKKIEFECLIPYIIHDNFYEFLINEFNLSNNIYIYDKLIEKNIKVSKLKYNKAGEGKEEKKHNNTLLLPMVY